jgi:hypothetical protein
MFTLKKVLKVIRRGASKRGGRLKFLKELNHELTGLCIATLRRHRDGHMYASNAQEMFAIIDKLEPMIKNSIKQRESNQLTFADI